MGRLGPAKLFDEEALKLKVLKQCSGMFNVERNHQANSTGHFILEFRILYLS